MRTRNQLTGGGRRGFTLLEVMIVIVIILAILGLVTVNLMSAKKKADTGTTQMQLGSIRAALDQFFLDFSRYPAEDGEGLAVLWNKTVLPEEDQTKWRPYMKEALPRDQWGSDWGYRVQTAEGEGGQEPLVWSFGPDKQDGTEDDVYPTNKKPTDSGGGPGDVGPPPSKPGP